MTTVYELLASVSGRAFSRGRPKGAEEAHLRSLSRMDAWVSAPLESIRRFKEILAIPEDVKVQPHIDDDEADPDPEFESATWMLRTSDGKTSYLDLDDPSDSWISAPWC